jgi:hypothetical protein
MEQMGPAGSLCFTTVALTLAGCGGGSSEPPSYGFVTPAMNSQRTYAVTDTTPTSTSVNTVIRTVNTVNSDGSFSYSETVPGGTVTGPNFMAGDYSVDGTGHILRATLNPGTPGAISCTDSPRGSGPVFPLTVGVGWNSSYQSGPVLPLPAVTPPGRQIYVITGCSFSAASYTETGSVTDVESITVAAGTFIAVRLEITISWDVCPAGCRETITEWRDSSDGQLLKSAATYSYGSAGTLTTTALLSETRELQSQ